MLFLNKIRLVNFLLNMVVHKLSIGVQIKKYIVTSQYSFMNVSNKNFDNIFNNWENSILWLKIYTVLILIVKYIILIAIF